MLEDVRELPEDVHHPLGDLPVQVVVRPDVHRVGRLTVRHGDGHPAPDPEGAGLVARGHDDPTGLPALREGSDAHGLPDEARILETLHADVERVHVHMEDHSGGRRHPVFWRHSVG